MTTNIHKKKFKMHWGDMDALAHMNHARFFDYFQECRIDWLAQLDLKLSDSQGPVVIKAECTYLKPLVYPATLDIVTSIHTLGRSSFILDHNVYENENLSAAGSCKIVWIDYVTNESIPFPDKIRTILNK